MSGLTVGLLLWGITGFTFAAIFAAIREDQQR